MGLVIERSIEEAVLIGSDIIVRVVNVRGGRVKLHIMAPDSLAIDREEVRRRIDTERTWKAGRPGIGR